MSVGLRGHAIDGRTGSATRHEFTVALGIAILLVLARSYVYAAYEHAHFDSDQAIVGLMAKHLSEGRAFPLFYYGQPFMLAVEAWLMAPVFWIGGATVAALRASLIVTNLAVVTLLIVGLIRNGGLRPLHALVAALVFAFPPPLTAAHLVEAQGGNVEPFLFVVLLWFVRNRPFWFGSLAALGFLTREFTIYAVPVLLAGQMLGGTLRRRETLRHWLFAAVAFLIVWDGVDALKAYASLRGPGTRGEQLAGFGGSQLQNLEARLRVNPADVPARAQALVTRQLPRLLIGAELPGRAATERPPWVRGLFVLIAGAGLVRIAMLAGAVIRRHGRAGPREESFLRSAAFGWYLLGVGLTAAAAYVAVRPADDGILRYMLLALFIPVGAAAVLLALEPHAWIRQTTVAVVLGWAVLSGIDNARQLMRFASGGEPNEIRALADALVARNVRVAEAPYWRAYKLTFLTAERVKLASSDYVRIDEYQVLAEQEGETLRHLREHPCPGGEAVVGWYLCPE